MTLAGKSGGATCQERTKAAAARDVRRKSKNSKPNHVTTVNVLIGYFPNTMAGATLTCHTFVTQV